MNKIKSTKQMHKRHAKDKCKRVYSNMYIYLQSHTKKKICKLSDVRSVQNHLFT